MLCLSWLYVCIWKSWDPHHLVALVSRRHLGTGGCLAQHTGWGLLCPLTGVVVPPAMPPSPAATAPQDTAGQGKHPFPRLLPLLRRTLKASWAPPPQTKPSASTPTAAPAAAATLQQTAARQPSILHVHTCTPTAGCPRQMSRRALGDGYACDCKRLRSESAPLNSLPTTQVVHQPQSSPPHLLLYQPHLASAGAAALCAQLGGLPRGTGPPHGQAACAFRVGQAAEQA